MQPLEPRRLLSAPIVITSGGTYTGTWTSTSTTQPAVLIDTTAPVTLLDSTISGPGNLIATGINGVQLTVQDCTATALNPNVAGVAPGEFLDSINAASLTIENNTITNAGGYVINVDGFIGTGSDTITILNNSISNVNGMYSNGDGGYESSGQTSPHAIILNNVVGVAGINIGWNQIVNTPGESYLNDIINVYDSSGTSASPIDIHDNYIQGLYAIDPETQSDSGSGIITDGGLTDETAYVNITNNILVSTGNAGINVAAGYDINVTGNTCISSGYLPNGDPIFADNVGISIWDEMSGGSSSTFYNDGASDNTSGWMQAADTTQNTTSAARANDYWMPSDTTSMTYSNTSLTAPITAATQTAEFTAWQAKLTAANQTVGVPSAPATTTSTSTTTGASTIVTSAQTSDLTLTGKWWSGTFLSGYYGSNFLNDGNQLKGQSSVTFNIPVSAAGNYDVAVWYPASSTLADNVPVTIDTASGPITKTINETQTGGQWVDLGTYAFSAGTAKIIFSNTGTTSEVVVNAVKLTATTAAPAPATTTSTPAASVIVSTSESSDVTLTGKWWSGSFLSGYYGSSFLNDGNQLQGQKSVTFNATLPAAGSYQVYIWDPSASTLASNVPVTIVTSTGDQTVTVNEQIDGGEWVLLGDFNLNVNAQVIVSNTGANGEVAANAVMFVQNG